MKANAVTVPREKGAVNGVLLFIICFLPVDHAQVQDSSGKAPPKQQCHSCVYVNCGRWDDWIYLGSRCVGLWMEGKQTMEATMTAIEMTAMVDKDRQLQLDGVLPFAGPQRVRVIVLYRSDGDDKLDDVEWLKAAAANPAFADLGDLEEDIYTLADGKPFRDQA